MTSPACCNDFVILYPKLLHPEYRTGEEEKFLQYHGVLDVPLKDLKLEPVDELFVKVTHRCDQLTDAGLCRVYELRPEVCRAFDCKTRKDCACHGEGKISK